MHHISSCLSAAQIEHLPDEALLRLPQVLRLIPVSKSTFWAGVKSGRFPRRVKDGHATFWRVGDIRQYLNSLQPA